MVTSLTRLNQCPVIVLDTAALVYLDLPLALFLSSCVTSGESSDTSSFSSVYLSIKKFGPLDHILDSAVLKNLQVALKMRIAGGRAL